MVEPERLRATPEARTKVRPYTNHHALTPRSNPTYAPHSLTPLPTNHVTPLTPRALSLALGTNPRPPGPRPHMKAQSLPALFKFLAASLVAAGIASLATAASVASWYPTLAKPAWNPPAAVFGPVWTLLYVLMSIAAWRVWLRRDDPLARNPLAGFFAQLALNALWSVLFFGLRQPALAFAEILLLWLLLAWLQLHFARIDRLAALLWLPYLAWVSFAAALNGAIWHLNR